MENKTKAPYIYWPKLYPGVLIRRYKRFLADIQLDSGEIITAHCANSGRMTTCSTPGNRTFVSYHDNPKRKLKYTWELIEIDSSWVGVNTGWPNKLVAQAISAGVVEQLKGYPTIKPEIKVGERSRLDLLLTNDNQEKCFVEVKNCTLVENRIASFPDAVTTRGQKHLEELKQLLDKNVRCVMFYLVQRMDADLFMPADSVDPAYGRGLREAHEMGVEILVYDVTIDREKIGVNKQIPFDLSLTPT